MGTANRRTASRPVSEVPVSLTPAARQRVLASTMTTAKVAMGLLIDLLSQRLVTKEAAQGALERLRASVKASEVSFWLVDRASATRMIRTSGAVADVTSAEVVDDAVVVERLRRHDALFCRAGEVSGVEQLVSHGVRSFVVVSGPSPFDQMGVLVLGWAQADPRCNLEAVDHLRAVAAFLQRSLAAGPVSEPSPRLADDILGSLPDRVAVIDRDGTIAAVNAQWWASVAADVSIFALPPEVGTNYYDAWRREMANALPQAAEIRAGVQHILDGQSSFFQTAYPCHTAEHEQWCLITATPLRANPGSAVVAHTFINARVLTQLARQLADRAYQRLGDGILTPVWVLAPDGHVVYGNQRWRDIAGDDAQGSSDSSWTNIFHVDDRTEASSAFAAAVADRGTFELELRTKTVNGSYRWATCIGAPVLTIDGDLEGHVVFCSDISAKRNAEWAANELAAKLLAASEAERSRIGRELHDDLGQQVVLLAAKFALLARSPRLPISRLRDGLDDAEKSIQELAVAIHNLSHQLHPAKLRLIGLVATLGALCRDISASSGVRVRFNADAIPTHVPERIALSAYRVAQEALQNAVKHSGAEDIEVFVAADDLELLLRVTDRGRGFDPFNSDAAGIGLLTMRERVELSGGRLRIDAGGAGGTTIEARLPI
jgi:PAS domain S-box-containing protein